MTGCCPARLRRSVHTATARHAWLQRTGDYKYEGTINRGGTSARKRGSGMNQPDGPGTANPARVHDALLGGKDNYEADRAEVERLSGPLKDGLRLADLGAQAASDVDAEEAAKAAREYDNALPTTQTNRNRSQVTRFSDGLELIEPGVVQLNKWRPDSGDVGPGIEISSWAGLGLKH